MLPAAIKDLETQMNDRMTTMKRVEEYEDDELTDNSDDEKNCLKWLKESSGKSLPRARKAIFGSLVQVLGISGSQLVLVLTSQLYPMICSGCKHCYSNVLSCRWNGFLGPRMSL